MTTAGDAQADHRVPLSDGGVRQRRLERPADGRLRRGPMVLVIAVVATLLTDPQARAAAPRGVPAGFAPATAAWLGTGLGWVLGAAPCGSRSCPVLLRTSDGGRSWWRIAVPQFAGPVGARAALMFADPSVGMITDGERLYVTQDGGGTWRRAVVDGAAAPIRVIALGAEHNRLHAVVVGTSTTRLHTASPRTGHFRPVPGVAVHGVADGEIVVGAGRVHVVLAAVHRIHRYWVGFGRHWAAAAPPCPVSAATELAAPVGSSVFALCSADPGMGRMVKSLKVSDSGAPFRTLGRAPQEGITTGFAAVSASAVAVTAVGRGAGWLHLGSERGTRWVSPLVTGGPPLYDPLFTDAHHGVLVRGGPQWGIAQLLITHDGGRTWKPVDFSST